MSSITSLESAPSVNYINSIGENFPSPTRVYKIDAGISNRFFRDFLPINASLSTSSVNDSYLEFIIHPSDREFINTENVFLEVKLKITQGNGEPLDENSHVSVIDGLGHTLISRSTVYLNSTICESNAYKGIWEYVKSIVSSRVSEESSTLRANYYRRVKSTCIDTVTDGYFTQPSSEERQIIQEVKNGIHLMIPLNLNISSADFYLLDNVELRIRLDLNPASYILLSNQSDNLYSYEIQLAKIHVEKISPQPSALLSLNKTLLNKNMNIEYVLDIPLIKTHVFPSGYNTLTIDNAFNGFIPNKLFVFFIAQSAMSGSYTRNPIFLQNCNLSSLTLNVNGNIHSHLTGSFPNSITQYMIKSLINLGSENTLITYENYKSGRTIFVFDLSNTNSSDCVNISRKGNVRLSLQTGSAVTENMIIFLVGISNGTLLINTDRNVQTSF